MKVITVREMSGKNIHQYLINTLTKNHKKISKKTLKIIDILFKISPHMTQDDQKMVDLINFINKTISDDSNDVSDNDSDD